MENSHLFVLQFYVLSELFRKHYKRKCTEIERLHARILHFIINYI